MCLAHLQIRKQEERPILAGLLSPHHSHSTYRAHTTTHTQTLRAAIKFNLKRKFFFLLEFGLCAVTYTHTHTRARVFVCDHFNERLILIDVKAIAKWISFQLKSKKEEKNCVFRWTNALEVHIVWRPSRVSLGPTENKKSHNNTQNARRRRSRK